LARADDRATSRRGVPDGDERSMAKTISIRSNIDGVKKNNFTFRIDNARASF
jgi:hypothetical protein